MTSGVTAQTSCASAGGGRRGDGTSSACRPARCADRRRRPASRSPIRAKTIGIDRPNGVGSPTARARDSAGARGHLGEVTWDGNDHHQPRRTGSWRRRSAVPQNEQRLPDLSIEEEPPHGATRPKKLTERLGGDVDLFLVLRRPLNQRAGALSGGERQSLAMAEALDDESSCRSTSPAAGVTSSVQDETSIRAATSTRPAWRRRSSKRRRRRYCDRDTLLDQGRDANTGRAETGQRPEGHRALTLGTPRQGQR